MALPDSFTRNIALRIHPSVTFSNSPIQVDSEIKIETSEKDPDGIPFIGRKQHIAKFIEQLKTRRGVYLVTGFRGMGKTSFVNHTVNAYRELYNKDKKKFNRVIPIHLTLSQNNPKEIDILKLIAISVFDKFKNYLKENNNSTHFRNIPLSIKKFKIIVAVFLLIAIPIFYLIFSNSPELLKVKDFKNSFFKSNILLISVFLAYLAFAVFPIRKMLVLNLRADKESQKDNAYNCIHWLVERCHSTINESKSDRDEVSTQWGTFKLFSSLSQKNKQYPIAGPKEIEYELQKFFIKARQEFELEFIIIFDELDKVEPGISNLQFNADMETFEKNKVERTSQFDLRDRKEAIINIISGLKNLFTNAEAVFVFIAGHEMFDASLADIADRQSYVSSIFTYIFNIESMLKEKNEERTNSNKISLSSSIEEFISAILIGPDSKTKDSDNERKNLFDKIQGLYRKHSDYYKYDEVYKHLSKQEQENHLQNDFKENVFPKVYFVLQNFVTYLTYRTNGSPKKIIRAIHEFIHVGEPIDKEKTFVCEFIKEAEPKANHCLQKKESATPPFYLYFSHHNQYRTGFLSYLYRPFLIQYGRSFKLQSDSVILSTPYLFDHLLKFHPFAFSLSNLELIPELLSSAKTPYIKQHLREIINHLGTSHLRETDIGLFDYKFYSRTLNEITYLSKLFESEAAAFNFTLDEGHLVKMHIGNKIKELRSIYSKFWENAENKSQQIYSIAHLNSQLGDLYFFEQEYSDAIGSYSDAIRPINNIDVALMNLREFITLIKNKLKIGLCFEKMNSFDEALAFYADSCQDTKRFMSYRLKHSRNIFDDEIENDPLFRENLYKNEEIDRVFLNPALNDVLQIILQCFLAKIIIEEKMGVEGITINKLGISLGSFLAIAEIAGKKFTENNLIMANSFLLTGKLLYYKNSARPSSKPGFDEEGFKYYSPTIQEHFKSLFQTYEPIFNKTPPKDGIIVTKRKPVLSFYMYITGLKKVMNSRGVFTDKIKDKYKGEELQQYLVLLTQYLQIGDQSFTSHHYRYIAGFLSGIGDCLLAMHDTHYGHSYNEYHLSDLRTVTETVLNLHKANSFEAAYDIYTKLKRNCPGYLLPDILWCYQLSAKYFQKHGRVVTSSFQYRKILHVIRMLLKEDNGIPSADTSAFITLIEKNFVTPIIEIAEQNSGYSTRHMLNKALKLQIEDYIVYNNMSNHPETREAILLFFTIKSKLETTEDVKNYLKLISPLNTIATMHSRIFELHFYANCMYKTIDLDDYKKIKDTEQSIVNYLYSMLSILQVLKIYGVDYWMSFSFLASVHYKLAKMLKEISVTPHIDIIYITDCLKNLTGIGSYASLDYVYHFQMARDNYKKTIQTHTAGTEYRKAVADMVYLEDDFNDNAYHFGAAMDRYLMINGEFENNIEKINKILETKNNSYPDNFIP